MGFYQPGAVDPFHTLEGELVPDRIEIGNGVHGNHGSIITVSQPASRIPEKNNRFSSGGKLLDERRITVIIFLAWSPQ